MRLPLTEPLDNRKYTVHAPFSLVFVLCTRRGMANIMLHGVRPVGERKRERERGGGVGWGGFRLKPQMKVSFV